MTSPAAWHPDPTGRHEHRYWDGERWTEHVADAGQASVDPLDSGPTTESAAGGQEHPSSSTERVATSSEDELGRRDQGGWAGDAGTTGTSGTGASWQQPDTAGYTAGSYGAYEQRSGGTPTWQQSPYTQQPPSWGQTGAGNAPGNDGLAIAALVIGILSLLTSWILIGAFGGIIAIVLGFIALSRIRRSGQGGKGMAITGIVTGALSIVVAGLVIAFFGFVFSSAGGFGFVDDYVSCIEAGNSEAFCDQQLEEGVIERFGG